MSDKIIVNVSSYQRINSLIESLKSIYDQCDEINVCLNNHSGDIPNFLFSPKINLTFTDNSKGDAFKFLYLDSSDGYFLTIDDDLIYPSNYIEFMIGNCKKYNNKKIITLHGRNFSKFPISSYYKSATERFQCLGEVKKDVRVQFGGTGVMCFHTSLIKTNIDYFLYPNMVDIWIGKLAKDNNIEIICLEHRPGYIKEIPQETTIYYESVNNDKLQTKIVNDIFLNKKNIGLSVIIPTFNNIEYVDETLNSVMNSGKNHNIEILVGIDGCEKTLNYIKQKTYPDFVKFYYFTTNNGPYDIKNSLVQISNSDNLLFFDSDDIMMETTISDVVNNIGHYDMVGLRYKEIINGKIQDKNEIFHEGNFAIKKSIFLSMNGFEPWMCSADSDFLSRFYRRKPKIFTTKNISLYYRRHNSSLTKRPDTGMSSRLRGGYVKASKMKKGDGNPPFLHTRRFELVTTETFQVTKDFDYQKEIRNQKLDKIFNKTIRKVVDVVEEKKVDPIILDGLNFLQKTKVNEPRIIKTNNNENLANKKIGTTTNTIKELFSIKPNHREGKNFINLGGKFIK